MLNLSRSISIVLLLLLASMPFTRSVPVAAAETTVTANEIPDFEGIWTRQRGFQPHGKYDTEARLTDAALKLREVYDEAADPAIQCIPFGYFRQSMAVYPMEIIQDNDLLVFRYELWDAIRGVYMDGRERPAEGTLKTPMGYSIGHYEGSTLVIETFHIAANVLNERIHIDHSDQLEGIERYTRSADGQTLMLEMVLTDPLTLTEPFVVRQEWRLTPEETLLPYGCVDISGQH